MSKYFDTLNHELLMNLLHKQIQDMRVLRLVKKYLKSGVMENGVICKTEEGSPQGGPLSPLLANIYLNEFDWEMYRRGVKLVRYAAQVPNVHLEAVEEAQNEGRQFEKAGHPG